MENQNQNERVKKLETTLLNSSDDPLKTMFTAARNCYFRGDIKSLQETFDETRAIQLLTRNYQHGHLSIFEQNYFQFGVEGASRSLLAQFTRHRVGFSFAVQSQHYQLHDDFQFKDLEEYADEEHQEAYYGLMENINDFYKMSLDKGIKRYIAREALPNATCCNIVVSSNLRALDSFWKLRYSPNNTPEITVLSRQMYDEVRKVIPSIKLILSSADYSQQFEKEIAEKEKGMFLNWGGNAGNKE